MTNHDKKLLRKRKTFVIASCGVTLLLSGCAERKARGFPWATAVLVRPLPPVVRSSDTATVALDLDPNFRVETPASASHIFSLRSAPPRPRSAAPAATEAAGSAKTADLVPELSPQETAAAKEQVTASLSATERNVAAARGRNLSPAQKDVLSKIAGFVAEAREAAGEGDWSRARNLAKKAQILSEDLVATP